VAERVVRLRAAAAAAEAAAADEEAAAAGAAAAAKRGARAIAGGARELAALLEPSGAASRGGGAGIAAAAALEDARADALSLRALVAAKRLALLAELRGLYPIAESDRGRRWTIRGIVLPAERDFATAPDEQLSTALGYVAHTLSLAAK
jgi:hypothetical protein